MKAIEFIYQEHEIHFLVNPTNKHVMINATEMAKKFGKRTDHYLQNETTKTFIDAIAKQFFLKNKEAKVPDMSGTLAEKIINNRGRNGIYFCELLAIDFATWLDVDFKVWVYERIQEILFGNYQKHWEAHAEQEIARIRMNELKSEILKNPTPSLVMEYFETEENVKQLKNAKTSAIKNQLRLFASEQ